MDILDLAAQHTAQIHQAHAASKTRVITGGQWTRPTHSDSMGVSLRQIDEAEERNKRHGINVTYDRQTGCAIIPSREEQRKLMRVMGLRDNNAFY